MYRALYRKWRPQTFGDVVGQEAITAALSHQIVADKIGHAYLFTGTRGTGKTSCAKIFAKAVNCESRDGAEPCGSCAACKGLDGGSILDVVEIDAASNNSVDDVRDLRDETAYRPAYCRFRVYIIDEVHMLSTQAFNALLKILEEPPGHVIFILATTEIHKVPATILSRCQRFDFYRIPPEKIAGRLLMIAGEEGIALSDAAADLIARIADGSMRDAISLLDTCASLGEDVDEVLVRRMAGVADKSYLYALSDGVRAGDVKALMAQVGTLREQSIDVRRLCEELVAHYRNVLLALADASGALLVSVPADEKQYYLDNASNIGEGFAIAAMKRLAAALDRMGRSPDPRIELELALFDLCEQNGTSKAGGLHTAPATPPQSAGPVVTAQPQKPEPIVPDTPAAPVNIAPVNQQESPAVADTMATEPAPPMAVPPNPSASTPVPDAIVSVDGTARPAQVVLENAEGVPSPVAFWAEVLQQMAGIDRMLYSYMQDTTAYTDGKRVLIAGGDVFLTFMQNNAPARERIKAVIQQVSGRRYGIGPYKPPAADTAKRVTAQDTLKQWGTMGVDVQYDNNREEEP